MKSGLLILLLALPLFSFAQSKNISVISAERLNVVYRGIENPIKIVVPGARSFTASGLGMKETSVPGNYIIIPGSGLEVKVAIDAIMEDGSNIHEEKIFRIKGLPSPIGTINGYDSDAGAVGLSKEELMNATVGMKFPDFLFDVKFDIKSFMVSFPEKKHMQPIIVEGNIISKDAAKAIKKLKSGDLVLISEIRCGDPTTCYRRIYPVMIEIDGKRFPNRNE